MRGHLITTKAYSKGFKRNNSVIRTKDKAVQIYDIIQGKLFCVCDEVCICVEETFLLCNNLVTCSVKKPSGCLHWFAFVINIEKGDSRGSFGD